MAQEFPILTLKPERDWPLRNHHHAIYKNAVAKMPDVKNGAIVEVQNSAGDFLCYATYNVHAFICGRAIAFEKGDPLEQLRKQIERSIALRQEFFRGEDTTAIRLINAEGDAIPGLIVDQYNTTLVVQFTTLGMDRLRDWVVKILMETCKPSAIFEKSSGASRKTEGLDPKEGWIQGSGEPTVEVRERGLTFLIDLAGSQKTGLFLDQREMRSMVRSLAKGRTVLDCCSYVGGFSVSALAGGALSADAVDYDDVAMQRVKEHAQINGLGAALDAGKLGTYTEDIFDFLRRGPLPRSYDFVILDPPAFAKRSTDLEPAKRAYTDLNRMGMQALAKAGGLLLTCSCSYQVDAPLFQTLVFHAARQAKRSVRILQRHRQALDHPVNLYYPEGDYLKSLLLWVS